MSSLKDIKNYLNKKIENAEETQYYLVSDILQDNVRNEIDEELLEQIISHIKNELDKTYEVRICFNCGKPFIARKNTPVVLCERPSPQNKKKICKKYPSVITPAGFGSVVADRVYKRCKAKDNMGWYGHWKAIYDDSVDQCEKGYLSEKGFMSWLKKYY